MNDSSEPALVRRTCITVDLEGYSTFGALTQKAAQRGLAEALDTAAATTGLQRTTWQLQDAGDGEFAVLPLGEDESLAVGTFPTELDTQFRMLHEREGLLLRARLAINHGMVTPAAKGFAGWGPCDAARIVNAPAVREALRSIPEARIVVALSPEIYRDLVQQGHTALDPAQFKQVTVPRTGLAAWIMIPRVHPDLIPDEVDDDLDDAADQPVSQQATAENSSVMQSGRDTTGNVSGSNNFVVGSNSRVTGSNNTNSPVNNLYLGPRND
ncbi:hypothetical protein [Pseudonocardia zijingensis]|jgi:hypothetical protein|uniref:Guanylate cyclase domain-containing protein n=1 Tax=Pseudonocardia zijingensis TaxID=153376 RepID=A0ABP3ZTD2_9PSEU